MRIIEIAALENGAHRNQTCNTLKVIPEGWAIIPDSMVTENFPFGEIETQLTNNIYVVTKWTPGVIPTPEEPKEPETGLEDVSYEALAQAITEGVNDL